MSALLEKIKLSKYPSSVWLGKVNGQEIIDLIEQQQAEIDTLKAHVERLREALAKCHDEHIDYYVSCDDVKSALDATPQQNLNAVKREVYADGFFDGYCLAWHNEHSTQQEHIDYALEQSEIFANIEYPSGKEQGERDYER